MIFIKMPGSCSRAFLCNNWLVENRYLYTATLHQSTMKNTSILFSILLVLFPLLIRAQTPSILPAPVRLEATNGFFTITPETVIVTTDDGDAKTANFLKDYLQTYYALDVKSMKDIDKAPGVIRVKTRKFIKAPEHEEGYSVNVTEDEISLEGNSYAGTFYAMQSLLQLMPVEKKSPLTVPGVSIDDHPKFGYRGMHLDVSRHFFPVSYIKKYIDLLAYHKLNTFHWHLTDDQGWRIEITKYPRLTSVGGYRNGTIIGRYPGKGNDSIKYGGFYTNAEIRDIVKYAADRFITIIPEVDVPGHSSAAIAAYPYLSCFPSEPTKPPFGTAWAGTRKGKQVQQAWGIFPDALCAGKETTFHFLQDVFDEVIDLFPSQYIHIGGDENEKDQWKRCPQCQHRMKQNGLKNEHELQAYFVQRLEKYINQKGRTIIGWNEILEGGLAPNAVVMSWQGERGGIEAVKQGHKAIMVPEDYLYFNYSQTSNEDSVSFGRYTPIDKTYGYHPIPKSLTGSQANLIIGAQGNLWTEYIKNTSILEYNLLPRLSALSEMVWSEKKDWKEFEQRLLTQMKRYELWKVNYSKALFEIKYAIAPAENNEGLNITLADYKYKDFVHAYRDTLPYEAVVFDSSNDTKEYQRHERVPLPVINNNIHINLPGVYTLTIGRHRIDNSPSPLPFFSTKLHIATNKATGKKITLKNQPSSTYPGKGAFGLVNGVKAKDFNSKEWLGFSGKNLEAVIDLGNLDTIYNVVLHTWKQEPSWFYLPVALVVSTSRDSVNWSTASISNKSKAWNLRNDRSLSYNFNQPTVARYVRVVAHNYGKIPKGKPGAGRNAWLFVDEIEVN